MSENRAVIEQELRRVLRHGSGQVLGLELGAPHTAPLAGQALRQGSGQAWQPARSYDAAIGGALARGAVDSWERADPLPTRRTITGDYLVPLLQAVTLGVLVGGGLLLTFGEPILARGAGTLATVGWYLRGIWSTGPGVLWRSETVFGRDINGDGHVGRPPAPERQKPSDGRPIIAKNKGGVTGQPVTETWPTLDVSNPGRRLARDLAEFLAAGARDGYSIRTWKGRRLSSGTEITDPIWREWVSFLSAGGILETSSAGTRLIVSLDDALRSIF